MSRLLGGRYRLHDVLGRGAMGTVWAGRDELLHRDVAVKEVLPPRDLDDAQRAEVTARTLREARVAARIASPSAVTVYDVVDEDERPWIVMERLAPRTLADVVHERGRLPAREVATLGLAVLDGLDAAHAAGVLHRDVKPGNVMVDGDRVVLTDFGIAHLDGDPSSTGTGQVMGSPPYLAPERAQGRPASPSSDLWSLGATLYAAAEGHPPFEREGALPTLAAIVTEDAPPAEHAGPLAPVLAALLDRDPARRPDSARLRGMLSAVAAGEAVDVPARTRPQPVVAPPATAPSAAPRATPLPDRPAEPRRGGRSRAVLLAVAALALVAAVVALVLQQSGTETPPDTAAAPTTAPTSASSPSPSSPATTSAAPAPAPAPAPEPEPAPQEPGVPEGFQLYEDETGFSVAVPEGWTAEREGPRVRLSDPASSRYLLVDQTDTPQADPVEDWQRQEQSVSQRLEGYELISIEPVTYRDYDAADWQFTHGSGERIRVLNRNMITAPDQAYALYWSVPEAQWEESQPVLDVVLETFAPVE